MPVKKGTRGVWNKKYTFVQANKVAKKQRDVWSKENTRIINLRFNFKNDKDILDKLDSVNNKADYIRLLILKEISGGFIFTKMTRHALSIAFKYHKEQVDKAGMPYILHPISIAMRMPNEILTTIALLHDCLEDTDISIDELQRDFPQEVIDALKLLTHDKNVPYFDYIQKIKENENATAVKIADLKDNSNLSRLTNITQEDIDRQNKYLQAISILSK